MKHFLFLLLLPLLAFGGSTNIQNANLSGTTNITGTLNAPASFGLAFSNITDTPTTAAGYGITGGAVLDGLAAATTTGTGSLVYGSSPTLHGPVIDTIIEGTYAYHTVIAFGAGARDANTWLTISNGEPVSGSATTTISTTGGAANQFVNFTTAGTGTVQINGQAALFSGGPLGTPASGNLANCTGLPPGGITDATKGDVYYSDGAKVVALAPGTSGQFLQTQGSGAIPQWAAASGGGGSLVASGVLTADESVYLPSGSTVLTDSTAGTVTLATGSYIIDATILTGDSLVATAGAKGMVNFAGSGTWTLTVLQFDYGLIGAGAGDPPAWQAALYTQYYSGWINAYSNGGLYNSSGHLWMHCRFRAAVTSPGGTATLQSSQFTATTSTHRLYAGSSILVYH